MGKLNQSIVMRYLFILSILLASFLVQSNNDISPDEFEKSIKGMQDTKEKADKINDYVDILLKPEPTLDNCKKAKPFALQAAKISETLNYKTGMARSYEQLTVIFKTLDFQIQYLKYKSKAALVDRGEEMKKQKDQIEKQNENLEKQKEDLQKQNQSIEKQKADLEKQQADAARIKAELALLAKDNTSSKEVIAQKQKELLLKQQALGETAGQLSTMTEEATRLATENKLLEQDKLIKELEMSSTASELKRQRLQMYVLISGIGILLILALILFNLFKTKQKTAKELAAKNEIINIEKKRSEELLLNILPLETANELKLYGKAKARDYEMVTVLFTDFKDFTLISEQLSPKDLVDEIDMCYCAFDTIIEKHGIEKIKTIGDAYLCAYGIAHDIPEGFVHDPSHIINAAFEIVEFMKEMYQKRTAEGKPFFRIRVGVHSGPLVAGVVGRKKFAYDIWGDTVNTAARMEQNSEPGKINISSTTYAMVLDKYTFTHRGKIEAKNKGHIDMYFVDGKKKLVSIEMPVESQRME